MNILIDSVMALPDVQSSPDTRQIPIQRVGVRGVRHPIVLEAGAAGVLASVADWELTVALSAATKGTHMSRFVALLEQYRRTPMTPRLFCQMAQTMLDLLQADAGDISASFPFFINKTAPVSGVQSLMDYQVRWSARVRRGEAARFELFVQVPVTSLCPCSRAISEYGAHNQRSHISAELTYSPAAQVDMEDVIHHIEEQASCELWTLLKRADEKFVTERAYENPKFVEDLVRDVAAYLHGVPGVVRFRVEAENFESIHNHSAYAMVESQ